MNEYELAQRLYRVFSDEICGKYAFSEQGDMPPIAFLNETVRDAWVAVAREAMDAHLEGRKW